MGNRIKIIAGYALISLFLLACKNKQHPNTITYKADFDTSFSHGSNITTIELDSQRMRILTNLGMLWGFLKYHHHSINNGDYNMDAELFRVLPKVLVATDVRAANIILEQWVDHFGVPDTCKFCPVIDSTIGTKFMPDYGYLFSPDNFPISLRNKLEFIKQNRGDTSSQHYYVKCDTMVEKPIRGKAVFTNEREYSNNAYPDAGLRLLALYRYWNMIQYFYPDRHLIGEDWNRVLVKFIPIFCNAGDTLSYQLACLKLISSINDGHGCLLGAGAVEAIKGNFYSPFQADFLDGQLVITGYNIDSAQLAKMVKSTAIIAQNEIQPGDIIEQIDGVPIKELVIKYLPFTPGSNYLFQLHDLASANGWLLRGQKPDMRLYLMRNDRLFDVIVHKLDYLQPAKKNIFFPYCLMKESIGYICPDGTKYSDVDTINNLFKNTKGIIVDLRCYPRVFPFTYEWLKPVKSPFNIVSFSSIYMPGRCEITDSTYSGSDTGSHYKGKLIIVVNSETVSFSEYLTMALATVPAAIVVGSTTAGADGNISKITLPGSLITWFSGIGILYPDHTESQRVGVKIDKVILPTIKGIQEGRDEQLDYAIKTIENN